MLKIMKQAKSILGSNPFCSGPVSSKLSMCGSEAFETIPYDHVLSYDSCHAGA